MRFSNVCGIWICTFSLLDNEMTLQDQIEELEKENFFYRDLLKDALKALDEVYQDEDRKGNLFWRVGDVDLISDVYTRIEMELNNEQS